MRISSKTKSAGAALGCFFVLALVVFGLKSNSLKDGSLFVKIRATLSQVSRNTTASTASPETAGNSTGTTSPRNITQANKDWLNSLGAQLSDIESQHWLESQGYTPESILALVVTRGPDWPYLLKDACKIHPNNIHLLFYSALYGITDEKKSDLIQRLTYLDPDNPILNYIGASEQMSLGNWASAADLLSQSLNKKNPTAYLEAIKPKIKEMFQSAGRTEQAAIAWSEFGVHLVDLTIIPSAVLNAYEENPASNLEAEMIRAITTLDMSQAIQSVPNAGLELLTSFDVLSDHYSLIISKHPEFYLKLTGLNASETIQKIMDQQKIDSRLSFLAHGQHIDYFNQMDVSERESFLHKISTDGLTSILTPSNHATK